jgi:3-dehydroquinate dehydratase-1
MILGKFDLSKKQQVAVVLDQLISAQKLRQLINLDINILETRVDLWKADFNKICTFCQKIRLENKFDMILTNRQNTQNKLIRRKQLQDLLPYVDALDEDISSEELPQIIREVKSHNKKMIISYHNFKKTPANTDLQDFINKAQAYNADVIKIAVQINNQDDILRLLTILANNKQQPLIAFGMGKLGKITRLITPYFGSLLTYCSIKEAVAPGQFNYDNYLKIKKLL